MHAPSIIVPGNVGTTPVLREVGGSSVTSFRIANTPRRLDKATGAWNDLPTTWFGVSVWRTTAENVVQSLKQGDRVVVTGRLTVRTWETDKGDKRSGLEIEATSVGLDLSRGRAQYVKDAPLMVTQDPWASTGEVDLETGEVLIVPAEGAGTGGRVDPPAGAAEAAAA